MLEPQNALGNVGDLVCVVHNSVCVGNEGGHEGCEFVVSYPGLAHRIEEVYSFVHALEVGGSHHRERPPQTVACQYEGVLPIESEERVHMGIDLILHAVESLVEPNMNRAVFTEGVACSRSLEVQNPVGDIDAASEGDHDTPQLSGVSHVPIDTVGVVLHDLHVDQGDVVALRTPPGLDGGLRFVGDGGELRHFGSQARFIGGC